MSIQIGKYTFDGPFYDTNSLRDASGVYAILTKNGDPLFTVIDIGEASAVKARVANHDRTDCWNKNKQSVLAVAVLYTPGQHQAGRMIIEQELRRIYQPACGIR